ncbi:MULTISPECIES: efflux RND transporter periplasmic adaptor subunit [Novilysobacter]|uniref:efflux RND transporter periplasmic adaptor subunit n=1 Tax=Novilysobacter TaxID=3382699 RepID=UPI002FCBD36E
MNFNNRTLIIALSLAILAGGIGVGYWWASQSSAPPASGAAADGVAPATEQEVLYWYDPMVPGQHFDQPGPSPFMDMELVPKYADEATASGISIAPGTRQNLGIRTVEVERGSLAGTVSVPGTIGWDLRQEHVVSARVDAVVDRLFVKAPYQPVRAGEPLATILAPAWSSALAEARALGQADSASAQALQSAARERLQVLGLPPGATTRDGRIVLTSPVDGVVSEIGVREGQAAPTGMLLFRVNGTDTVWLEAAIPQAAVGAIVPGTPVEARVSTMPGRVFEGRVETLLPQIETGSRTQQARIVLDNPDGVLAPGMFAQITLQPVDGAQQPLVPSDAVIGAGNEARVILMDQEGRFRPVAVQTGRSGGGFTEILSGLEGGEQVVASGQFLIDSEANLSGALERLGTASGQDDAASDAAPDSSMPDSSTPGPGMPDMDGMPGMDGADDADDAAEPAPEAASSTDVPAAAEPTP